MIYAFTVVSSMTLLMLLCVLKGPNPQVNALVVKDLDMPLTEEVLQHLVEEDTLAKDFCQLSLHALAGTESEDAFKIRAKIKNKKILILIDSGSSHSFVSFAFLNQVGIQSVPIAPRCVRTMKGECWCVVVISKYVGAIV